MSAFIQIDGLSEAEKLTEDVQKRLRDLRPALRPAAEEFKVLVDDSFKLSQAPSGASWAKLADSTIRRRRGNSAKILVDSGRLRNSMGAIAQPLALRIGQVIGGRPPKYAVFHHYGTKRMPARPALPFAPSGQLMQGSRVRRAIERMTRYIQSYVTTGKVRG